MTDAYSTRKISSEQQAKHDKYLARALAKYGLDAFDYSKAKFHHSLAETTVICKECLKSFKTNAYLHTRPVGGGCPHCKQFKKEVAVLNGMRVRAKKNKTILSKLDANHGVAFAYTNARGAGLLVDASCKYCGKTNTVKTNEHIKKPICTSCGLSRKNIVENIKHKEYLSRALDRHGDKYDFSKAFMKSSSAKVDIVCNICGTQTKQTVSNIIHNSEGCRRCYYNSRKMDLNDFLNRVNEVHNNKYNYKQDDFDSLDSVIGIYCPTHGLFKQTARDHLKGGCRECGKSLGGWSRTRFVKLCKRTGKAILYAIKCYDNNESFYKIGITSNDLKTRFKRKGYLPYDYTPLFEIEGSPSYIFDLEVRLHSLLKDDRYEPKIEFGGYTECFTTIKPVEKLLKELSSTDQLQLIA